MIIIRNNFNKIKGNLSLAIGNFDGVHKGHKFILSKLRNYKKTSNDKIGVLTFSPHPVKVIKPNEWKKDLIRFRTKFYLLKEENIDYLFSVRFNLDMSQLPAEIFIEKYLIDLLKVKNILVGEDFRFGRNREGNVKMLNEYHNLGKFNFKFLKKIGVEKPFSSSMARKHLLSGNIEKTNYILGYNWEVTGKVVKGKAKGRELGFPTANIKYLHQIAPSNGIYACLVKVGNDREWRMAAISTGTRPQYKGEEKILEAHILDFTGNLYQKRLRVAFIKKIRNEEIFDSEVGLIKQMQVDCKLIKNFLINYK